MEKKIAILASTAEKSFWTDFFRRLSRRFGCTLTPVFVPTLEDGLPFDALLVSPTLSDLPVTKEFLTTNKLFARVREIVAGGKKYLLVDNAYGGIYDEEKGFRHGKTGREAFDVERRSEIEIEQIARIGYEFAELCSCPLTSVDLSDKLYTSRLWRRALHDVGTDYPVTPIEDAFLTDYLAKIKEQRETNVVVTTALFSDVLHAALYGYGKRYDYLSYCGEKTWGLYCPTDPTAIPYAVAALLERSLGLSEQAKDFRAFLREHEDEPLNLLDLL